MTTTALPAEYEPTTDDETICLNLCRRLVAAPRMGVEAVAIIGQIKSIKTVDRQRRAIFVLRASAEKNDA